MAAELKGIAGDGMARRDLTGAIDFAYLESYTAGDQVIIDEVLSLFREQAALWRRLLDPQVEIEGWRDAVHALKGAAGSIGARDLAQACAAAERGSDSGHGARSSGLSGVLDGLDLVLADIAAYQHEQALKSLKGGG